MRACLYARYSTDSQREQSIEDQLRVCERLAEKHGFTIVGRFSDAALSGGTALRPDYQRMLKAARRGEFEVIVAEDTSRLWRNLGEQAPRINELQDLGVHVVTHDLDTRHESAAILGPVTGAMAEQYRREIGRRTRRGLEGLARKGKSAGGRAYGYVSATDSGTGQREINPDAAAIVRRIFQAYADGDSPRTIAATLNRDKVPSPGASWSRTSRRRTGWMTSAIAGDPLRGIGILNNDAYRGVLIWNRTRWVRSASDSAKRRCVPNPRSEWVEHIDERLRIVPDELWQRVKARQRSQSWVIGERVKAGLSRRQAAAGRSPAHIFSGWLVCGLCGARFTLTNRVAYACSSHVFGRACSNTIHVRRDLVERKLLAGVQELLADDWVIDFIDRGVRKRVTARALPAPDTGRREVLQEQIDNLVAAISTGGLRNSPALGRRLRDLEDELQALERAASAAQAAPTRLVTDVRARFARLREHLAARLSQSPERARAALQECLAPEIILTPSKEGRFLEAGVGVELTPLAAVAGGVSEFMVAGGRLPLFRQVIELR